MSNPRMLAVFPVETSLAMNVIMIALGIDFHSRQRALGGRCGKALRVGPPGNRLRRVCHVTFRID